MSDQKFQMTASWVHGVTVFAGVMMIVGGGFQAFEPLERPRCGGSHRHPNASGTNQLPLPRRRPFRASCVESTQSSSVLGRAFGQAELELPRW